MVQNTDTQTVFFDEGAIAELAPLLDSLRARRIFFVVDAAVLSTSAASQQLQDLLCTYDTVYFSEFEINPKISDVERGIRAFGENPPDVVVAFGGGTALDLAKMIRGLAGWRNKLHEIVTGDAGFTPGSTPLVAIPTTAGTGSEATHFAVVYRGGEKHSVAHAHLLPNYVILDPLLTSSMPPAISAATGLDALCQAIESIWAVGSTNESIRYAARAVSLAVEHLERAVHAPTSAARRAMCEAAHLSGRAINISKTTAPHAISYALTTCYRVPHGPAVAVTLPAFLEFNSRIGVHDCVDPRGAHDVQSRINQIVSLLGVDNVPAAGRKLEKLIGSVGCPVSLCDLGIVEHAEIEKLAAQANIQRLRNNPRQITFESLVDVLTALAQPRR